MASALDPPAATGEGRFPPRPGGLRGGRSGVGRGKRGQEVVQPSELGGVGGRGPGQPPSEGWAGFWGSEGPRRGGVGWGSWKAGWPTEGVGGGGGGGRRAAPAPAARLEHEPSIRPREDAAAAEPGPGLRAPPVSRVPGASGLARGGGRGGGRSGRERCCGRVHIAL